jgi:hypothetical protein
VRDAYKTVGITTDYLSQINARIGCQVAQKHKDWHAGGQDADVPEGAVVFW